MRLLDLGSWQGFLLTLCLLATITLIGVGIRLLVMQTVQVRRQRENRQINERLRTLIAAYRSLGGSFTGELAVDPTHLRELRQRQREQSDAGAGPPPTTPGSDRSRRIRDAVEAALSDILLLGTDAQVRLAAQAAADLAAGRPVHTAELVVSLRDFIREVLDLEPIPRELAIPRQGPTRPGSGRSAGRDGASRGREGGGRDGGGTGGGGMGGGGAAGGAAMGMGAGNPAVDG